MRLPLAVLAVLMCVAPARAQPAAAARIPVHVFAGSPRGPYRTGTIEEQWVDAGRELVVQLWYPADADLQRDSSSVPYALHPERYAHTDHENWLADVQHVRTTSVENAPLAAAGKRKLPLLIYNPGSRHPPFSATFQTEFLASHGYVVVAIGRPGTNIVEQGAAPLESFRAGIDSISKQQMPREVTDIPFVLDRLQAQQATRGSKFYQRLDLEHVGALGWSLGGALSLQASRDEPRIKAAANFDGWLYSDVAESGSKRPLLIMHSGADTDPAWPELDEERQELRDLNAARVWHLLKKTGGDWYDLTLARATHLHFSDRSLFEGLGPELLHPRLAHDIINNFTLEFFDKYLRGRTDTPLLSGREAYPEVKLLKRLRKQPK